ncbi:MAG: DUF3160 domain-containing protein [Actinobacteria bacterium]|nr:DUF3160 domain-containing protein [Actinomycetota bacterium]
MMRKGSKERAGGLGRERTGRTERTERTGRTEGIRRAGGTLGTGRIAVAIVATASLAAIALFGASCTDDPTTTSTTSPTVVTVAQDAKPFPGPEYVDPAPVNLAEVTNSGRVVLDPAAQAILERQGFVATNFTDGWVPWKFWQIYEEARYAGVPALVTTDAVLNSYHSVFAMTLQRLEETEFFTQLEVMSEKLQAAASDQVNEATGTPMEEAALATEAYFAVGNSLLKGGMTAPDRVRDEVTAEVALIEAAGGQDTSPVLGYTEDYSQYQPRGHYTRSETLERYFKAMMWYGHTAFWTDPHAPDVDETLARRLTRQAALITLALTGETEQAWKAIYEPTTFLVGTSDDLGPADLRPPMGVAFGSQTPTVAELADDAKIDALRAEIRKLAPPMIQSHQVWTTDDTAKDEISRSFRVMGQRYVPDSYAFQQLVWSFVGTAPDKQRMLPMGLDVMAVLGSDQAYELLTTTYGQQEFENYESQLMKVKAQFDTRAEAFWPTTIYTGWLDGLREAMAFPGNTAPHVMRTKAWARKSLNGALGSWTELRHDTILYAKQSVASEGDGGEEPEVAGYVEPYPEFYKHMAALAASTRDGLAAYDLLDENIKNKLDTMAQLCTDLERIARKELAGEALDETDAQVIRWFGNTLETLELFYDDEGRTISPPDEKSPVVADVHSDLNSNTALEEGTGYPLALYVVLEVNGESRVFLGASYDYYEFTVPLANRMTDEEWQAALDAGTGPPRPAWTGEFIVTPPPLEAG